jgi:hypothetical protein
MTEIIINKTGEITCETHYMNTNYSEMVDKTSWEAPYLDQIFELLKKDLDDEYNLIVARTNTQDEANQFEKDIIDNKKNILFLLSDERGIIPPFLDRLHLVFRTYNRKPLYDDKKIFAIPCGYSLCNNLSYNKSSFAKTEYIPLSERKNDIFYSGQMTSEDRQKCGYKLNEISRDKYNCIINYTPRFADGYKLDDYYKLMSSSKISIVPKGAVIPESFRYFESFKCNCIVITTYPINDNNYKHWYNEKSPAIFLNDWNELTDNLIDRCLNNINLYEKKNKEYFDEFISPTAVYKYILKKIKDNERS